MKQETRNITEKNNTKRTIQKEQCKKEQCKKEQYKKNNAKKNNTKRTLQETLYKKNPLQNIHHQQTELCGLRM
jgi:hypothetical protein